MKVYIVDETEQAIEENYCLTPFMKDIIPDFYYIDKDVLEQALITEELKVYSFPGHSGIAFYKVEEARAFCQLHQELIDSNKRMYGVI